MQLDISNGPRRLNSGSWRCRAWNWIGLRTYVDKPLDGRIIKDYLRAGGGQRMSLPATLGLAVVSGNCSAGSFSSSSARTRLGPSISVGMD